MTARPRTTATPRTAAERRRLEAVVWLVAAALFTSPVHAQGPRATSTVPNTSADTPVPSEYRDLWNELEADLDHFEQAVAGRDHGQGQALLHAAELLSGNGNRGMQLVHPGALIGARYELSRLHAQGAEAVTLAIGFPLLTEDFHAWTAAHGAAFDRAALLDFYRAVVGRAHALGMRVAVEAGPLFPGVYSTGSGFDVGAYYRDLLARGGSTPGAVYAAGRAETIRAIVAELAPDYLSFGSEPDTESELIGLPLAGARTQQLLIQYYLDHLEGVNRSTTALGAGIGTWQLGAEQFVAAYCETGIDFIDLHLYPIGQGFAERALALADAARACGKHVTMTEAWLLKSRHRELGRGSNAVDPTIFARDAYSFWAPLDSRFLQVTERAARSMHVELLSPFWSKYFWAYLDYGHVQATGCARPPHPCTPAELLQVSSQAAATAIVTGGLTSTGRAWAALAGPTRRPEQRVPPPAGGAP